MGGNLSAIPPSISRRYHQFFLPLFASSFSWWSAMPHNSFSSPGFSRPFPGFMQDLGKPADAGSDNVSRGFSHPPAKAGGKQMQLGPRR